MGRGGNEMFEMSDPERRNRVGDEDPWDGVEIRILCDRHEDGTVSIETASLAYDLDSTRPDAELAVGKVRPSGALTKAKLGEQISRDLMREISHRLRVPYDGSEWTPAGPGRGDS